MPHIRTETVYYFGELDEAAKERAREWYRTGALDYGWWDGVYGYCQNFLTLLGFDFEPKSATIYFSGFSSQGDGACFDHVSWSAKDVKADEAREEFGGSDEPEVRRLIDGAAALAATYPALSGYIKHRGHYHHERCTDISVDVDEDQSDEGEDGETVVPQQYENDYEEAFVEFARDCMRWAYRCLEREYEWLMSDEQVDEAICANEYEFTEKGKIA